MKYVKSTELIQEVKNMLDSYFNANKLDESILYRRIRYCLSKIKFEHHPYKDTVLVIEDYKTELPEDLVNLNVALLCYKQEAQHPLARYEKVVVTEDVQEYFDWGELSVNEVFERIHSDNNIIEKVIERSQERDPVIYNTFAPLMLSRQSTQCTDAFKRNQCSTHSQANLRNGILHTTVESGRVYIEYFAELEDDGIYMIPDKPRITEWIIADMMYQCLKYLYINGTPDILQRMQFLKQDANLKFLDAMSLVKSNELKDFYGLANALTARYAKSANNIWNEENYRHE